MKQKANTIKLTSMAIFGRVRNRCNAMSMSFYFEVFFPVQKSKHIAQSHSHVYPFRFRLCFDVTRALPEDFDGQTRSSC